MKARRARIAAPFTLLWSLTALGGLGYADVARAETLGQVCGPKTRYAKPATNSLETAQFDSTCRAGYAAGEAALTHDNNVRVWTPVAVVCAYGCMAGGMGSCAAGGGACSGMMTAGTKANAGDKARGSEFSAAQGNGVEARDLRSRTPIVDDTLRKEAANPAPESSADGAFGNPAICGRAARTGALSDRIGCASASDPSLPGFVSSPAFAREFQDITGFSLQSVINMNPNDIRNNVLPSALRNAYAKLSGKMTLAEFMGKATEMVKAVAGNMSDEDRRRFLANVLPGGNHDSGPGQPGAPAATAVAKAGADAGRAPAANPLDSTDNGARDTTGFVGEPGSWSEEDRNVSLFERVSYRYRLHSVGMGGG